LASFERIGVSGYRDALDCDTLRLERTAVKRMLRPMRMPKISERAYFYAAVAISMGLLAIIAVTLSLEPHVRIRMP
jgi:hypothetical protein